MNFTQLAREIPAILDSGISLELISAPGRGKSSFVDQTIDKLSKRDGFQWGLSTAFLATYTPPDLIGYQFKGERTYDGRTFTVTDPSMPLWMITREGKPIHSYKRGILFLDEFGQGEADVKRASAELLLNRRIGPWTLPEGWSVIAASNRASDRSGVTRSFDFVINRRLEIHITDDIAAWEAWALEDGVDPTFVAFAAQNPGIVFADGVPERQGPWCTPRSLVMAARLLSAKRSGPGEPIPMDAVANELTAGLVGEAAAAQLFSFVRLESEMPKYEAILKAPGSVKVPEKPDACMLVAYNLAARVTTDEAAPVITYMRRLPKEFAITFAKAAVRRNHALINTDAFSQWCDDNSSLVTAIVDRS